jgi:cytidylate kinase
MIQIAIDGPVGAGKSSTAKAVADKLGYVYVDTGALYRGIALYCIEKDTAFDFDEDVTELLPEIQIELSGTNVILNGKDVSAEIRKPEISMGASRVSAIPEVREFLFKLQQSFGEKYNVVMDGRDIGTVILPEADVKIFLTATPESRAKRRFDELVLKGVKSDYSEVLADLNKRDFNDSQRKTAPLRQAKDAVLIDTTELNFDETVEKIIEIIKSKIRG